MNAYREFWDVPDDEAPGKTGAASVMDCSDIREVLNHFGLNLHGRHVVDIGCGTGRIGDLCDPGHYLGVDVAPGMVTHTASRGYPAALIDGPESVRWTADLYLLLSVFTHVPRSVRRAYLTAIAPHTNELVADILPGEEGGSFAVWFANTNWFEKDLADAGFGNYDSYERVSPDGARHRYYHARKP